MEVMHTIVGPPCCGSTLLCDVLNQNPRFYASSTSALANLIADQQVLFANSKEVVSERIYDEEGQDRRQEDLLRGMCSSWYRQRKKPWDKDYVEYPICFDKGRGWAFNSELFTKLFPQGKIIVCVRDLRSIFASIQRQHVKTPSLDGRPMLDRTVAKRYQSFFSDKDGAVGQHLRGVEDLCRRAAMGARNLHMIRYEDFVKRPRWILADLYDAIGEPNFERHDFNNVESTAIDCDPVWNSKFSHQTKRKIEAPDPEAWKRYCHPDIAEAMFNDYPSYMGVFYPEAVKARAGSR